MVSRMDPLQIVGDVKRIPLGLQENNDQQHYDLSFARHITSEWEWLLQTEFYD